MKASVLGWALLGLVLGTFAYIGTRDPFPLQHEHPPHDSLGMAQQEGRGQYGPGAIERGGTAVECIDRGGVPLWIYRNDGVTSLSCEPGNIYGETH